MALETKEDVIAYLEVNRQYFAKKVGFKHMSAQLADIIAFIEKLAAENEQLKARVAKG
ncbi:MAG: hypothetical protein LBP91_02535 [Coriobacteriales bacterium]|nr:hypothetical protein [Coriobacteriales bacterium]